MSQITVRSLWKTHRQLVLVGVPCVSFDLRVRIDGLRNGVELLIGVTCGWCDQSSPVRWQVADRISEEAAALRGRGRTPGTTYLVMMISSSSGLEHGPRDWIWIQLARWLRLAEWCRVLWMGQAWKAGWWSVFSPQTQRGDTEVMRRAWAGAGAQGRISNEPTQKSIKGVTRSVCSDLICFGWF